MTAPEQQFTAVAWLAGRFRREFARRLATEPWAAEVGARPPMYGTLLVISMRGPISQREVADLVTLHPSEMVALIEQLEAAGFVARDRDPEDRRRYRLTLTADGERLLARFGPVARAAEDAVLAPLDPHERETLAQLCGKALGGPTLV